ncbi:MAG TPA: lactate utilization protein C [Burkholderiales bacterium]|nr:lactate utilization protein C [Burkholderiales bacterium]
MSARDNILSRVRTQLGRTDASTRKAREAVNACMAAHAVSPRPASLPDLAVQFRERALKLASTYDETGTLQAVPRAVARYLHMHALPLTAVCWPELAPLDWKGAEIRVEARPARGEDAVGITGAFCAIAETGTLVTLSAPGTPASVSLLPETHVAIVQRARIVRGMEEVWQLVRKERTALPRAVNFISGPSRTADIEQTVTLGAHGPYRVHIIVVG